MNINIGETISAALNEDDPREGARLMALVASEGRAHGFPAIGGAASALATLYLGDEVRKLRVAVLLAANIDPALVNN